jgi:hypothetical protein
MSVIVKEITGELYAGIPTLLVGVGIQTFQKGVPTYSPNPPRPTSPCLRLLVSPA